MNAPPAATVTVAATSLSGVWRLRWEPIADARGSVQPIYVDSQIEGLGLPPFSVVQTNLTRSVRGVIRGVHGELMHKMIAVLGGSVYAVAVDVRDGSAGFGRHEEFELGANEGLFLSSGLGNAFQSLSDEPSLYLYMFNDEWRSGMPGQHVNPLDPDLAIPWPITDPQILSEKDRGLPLLASIRAQRSMG